MIFKNVRPNFTLDFGRLLLGVFIMYQGYDIAQNRAALVEVMTPHLDWFPTIMINYAMMVHLAFGLMLAAGLKTRVSILVQLPVLLSIIIWNKDIQDFGILIANIWVSIATLLAFLFYYGYGSGTWSMDEYMKQHHRKQGNV